MAESVRTTISLDKEVYAILKNFAEARQISLGKAVDEMVLKTVNEKPLITNGLPVFQVSEKAAPFGLNEVKAAEDADI